MQNRAPTTQWETLADFAIWMHCCSVLLRFGLIVRLLPTRPPGALRLVFALMTRLPGRAGLSLWGCTFRKQNWARFGIYPVSTHDTKALRSLEGTVFVYLATVGFFFSIVILANAQNEREHTEHVCLSLLSGRVDLHVNADSRGLVARLDRSTGYTHAPDFVWSRLICSAHEFSAPEEPTEAMRSPEVT
jgi:hypothetical protein